MNSQTPFILSCSPRKNGNCDDAAHLFARCLTPKLPAPVVLLRQYAVSPCISCGHCSAHPGTLCPLQKSDQSQPLMEALCTANSLCFVAPIYFYHLPAHMKALIDRGQAYWMAHGAGLPPPGQATFPKTRKAGVILLAARDQGEQLFTGSLVTLRYWLKVFSIELAPPLLLYGVDQPGDFAAHPKHTTKIAAYADAARNGFG